MNRTLKESLTGGRNVTVGSLHRRGPVHKDSDDKLDLFAKNRRTLSVASSDESDISVKLGRLSVGSVKLTRNGVDDILSSTDGGKHDYDWLLTPPETPLTSSDGSETRPSLTAPRRGSLNRSASTAKTSSRLSVTHSESNNSSRPVRSSSVTRSSVSYNTQYNNSSTSYTNKSTSILNTSSSSVSSYSRPSTPTRSSSSIARPSTPSSRSISSRSSTPSRTRPGLSNSSSSIDRTKPSQTSRSQIPAITNSLTTRSVSRPSTPTRRNINPPPSTANLLPASTSNVRFPTLSSSSRPSSPNRQNRPTAPSSRPSSPSSRPRPTVPLVLPDFPLDTPPNLRTSFPPDRPLSAGRSRPGSVVTSKVNVEASTPNLTRRQTASPIRRLSEPNNTRGRLHGHGQATDSFDSHSSSRKPIKISSSTTTSMENNGFGRNISKKSMDMAMRHMDIRLSGSSLFPQSIRSGNNNNNKGGQAIHVSNGNLSSLYENGDYASYRHENGNGNYERLSVRAEPEFYETSRYDAILLKEDLKNTNWLHSIDDKSDQGSIFDHGFEPLPEPFDPL
ncbi:putative GPI-anchored protein pfl2 [Impatiens glandulifera]|uniref:putative GPI-anchored protein pfl2 n=1 Tax=Impatiens glandulifera TaxID=253017 RepID=UPI001FB16BC8|nr:putative GPI-anchored protein pfl2 [Impatiens glandulifera]